MPGSAAGSAEPPIGRLDYSGRCPIMLFREVGGDAPAVSTPDSTSGARGPGGPGRSGGGRIAGRAAPVARAVVAALSSPHEPGSHRHRRLRAHDRRAHSPRGSPGRPGSQERSHGSQERSRGARRHPRRPPPPRKGSRATARAPRRRLRLPPPPSRDRARRQVVAPGRRRGQLRWPNPGPLAEPNSAVTVADVPTAPSVPSSRRRFPSCTWRIESSLITM